MNCIKRLYSGRISRKQYAGGVVLLIVINIFIGFLFNILIESDLSYNVGIFFVITIFVWMIVCAIALFSLHSRRFRDFGKSGGNSFLLLIPFINIMVFTILLFKKGDVGRNKFGDLTYKDQDFLMDTIFEIVFYPKNIEVVGGE